MSGRLTRLNRTRKSGAPVSSTLCGRSMNAKLRMYRTGLNASRNYIVDEEPGYICPICLEVFRDPNELTREHVPPRSTGGKVLCLLCRACNSTAGSSMDAALHERAEAARVMSIGTSRRFLQLKTGEISVNASLKHEGTNAAFQIEARHNDPANVEQFRTLLQTPRPESHIQVWYPNLFNQHYALVGYLKVAYLYAFAKFGYGYILRDCMDQVRRQIQNPKTRQIWKWWLRRNENQDKTMLYLCDRPLNCLAVGVAEHIIILPSLQEPHDQYDVVRDLTEGKNVDELTGQFHLTHSFPAPIKMEMLCDRTAA